MTDETTYQYRHKRSRHAIASYLHRVADAIEDGTGVTVDPDGENSLAVQPPAESILDVEVERDAGGYALEIEIEWNDESDSPVGDPSDAAFELYEDNAGEYRWRLRHRNGNIIADSGEGYSRKADARNGLDSVKRNSPSASVEELE